MIYGDGEQSRDFIYIDNVVDANLKAAATPGIGGRVYNVASGKSITLNGMLHELAALIGVEPVARFESERPGASVIRWRTSRWPGLDLGFEVIVPFDEGLRRTVASLMDSALLTTR